MRLWNYTILKVLPRQQLLSQYRECCCIAKSIKEKGTPNHILVNKIMDYPIEHFEYYTFMVIQEMRRRGYNVRENCFTKYYPLVNKLDFKKFGEDLFYGWHNERYLKQCYYNLQEKYDCGGITKEEWNKIEIEKEKLIKQVIDEYKDKTPEKYMK